MNLNQLGASPRGSEARSPGMKPSEAPIQGLLRAARAPTTIRTTLANNAVQMRDAWFGKQMFELRAFNRADKTDAYALADETKFLATIHSGALNLSRHGTQRVNLNGLLGLEAANLQGAPTASPWSNYDPADAEIEKQVKRIVEAIRFHAPKFGERFYRNPAGIDKNAEIVPALQRDIYLYKLAANIRDYIDPDLQPTLINSQRKVEPRSAPISAINANATNNIWAQGKDGGLFVQEAVTRYRTSISAGRYNLKVDYYIEFWNMGTKDIYAAPAAAALEPDALGSNPFVRISNQQAWLSSPSGAQLRELNTPQDDPGQFPRRDMIIDLSSGVFNNGRAMPRGVVFKAGACTVVTTDPDYQTPPQTGGTSPAFSGGYNTGNIYYCSRLIACNNSGLPDRTRSAKREYIGPIGGNGIKPDFRDGGEDYDTEVILGNDRGYFDSHPAAIAMGGGAKVTTSGNPRDDWYGGTLLGNATSPSQLGDPRTNNEMLSYTRFMSGASTNEPDQARYFNTVGAPRFSLGFPNNLYVNPQNTNAWPDYYKGWNTTPVNTCPNPDYRNAPAFNFNGRITAAATYDPRLPSVGMLGDVFDPARVPGTRGTLGVLGSRGGGRTLRIGQKDDLIEQTALNKTSQQWAAWRLADFFSTSGELYQPGLININGIRRDNGAALRAICEGMLEQAVFQNSAATNVTYLDESDARMALNTAEDMSKAGLERIIDDIKARLLRNDPTQSTYDPTKPSYFRERGELSELERNPKRGVSGYTFSNGADVLDGVTMSDAFDRTREQFARRIMELITTRGNVFTVYVVGQAITKGRDAAQTVHVTGEHWKKVTFALLPRYDDGTDFKYLYGTQRLKGAEDWALPTASADPNQDDATKSDPNGRFIWKRSAGKNLIAPDHYDVQILQVATP